MAILSADAVVRVAARAALEKKAIDLVVLDLQGLSSVADFFLVCTARSTPQADTIADAGIRRVFLHVEKHGVITEPEVVAALGSPRLFRRFSLEFELHLAKLPFKVRIESGEGGKRYVREGDR